MDTNFSQFHQIIYRKYSLLTLGAILTILLFVFCYDAYSAYELFVGHHPSPAGGRESGISTSGNEGAFPEQLTYGKNTYLRGSR